MTIQDENDLKRVKAIWERFSEEPIEVEKIASEFYAFGSELAMLRLEHGMRVGRAKWSENLKIWSYCADRR